MQGTENLPEVVDRSGDIYDDLSAKTPKYNKMLENARDMVMEDRVKEYQAQPEYKPNWDDAGRLYRLLNPNPENDQQRWAEQADFYRNLVDRGTVNRGPGLVPSVQERFATGDSGGNVVDRGDINEKIVEQLIKDTHPEYAFNRTLPYAKSLDTDWKSQITGNQHYTNKKNLQRIAKELTGEDLDKLDIEPLVYELYGDAGRIDLETGQIDIADPTDVQTAIHEGLHQKYKEHGDRNSESQPELKDVENMDEAMRRAQRGHIPHISSANREYDAQHNDYKRSLYSLPSEGESGFYYDKIKELLRNK